MNHDWKLDSTSTSGDSYLDAWKAMNRRGILAALAALPFMGRLVQVVGSRKRIPTTFGVAYESAALKKIAADYEARIIGWNEMFARMADKSIAPNWWLPGDLTPRNPAYGEAGFRVRSVRMNPGRRDVVCMVAQVASDGRTWEAVS